MRVRLPCTNLSESVNVDLPLPNVCQVFCSQRMQESALSAAINNQLEQHVLISQFMTNHYNTMTIYLSDYASLASSPLNLKERRKGIYLCFKKEK